MNVQDRIFIETEDKSPTLLVTCPGGESETMHSRSGAWGETRHVYLPVLEKADRHQMFLSVGLGLGYVELMTAAYFLSQKSSFQLLSFEADALLRTQFLDWLLLRSSPHSHYYNRICEIIAIYFQMPTQALFQRLSQALKVGEWEVRGALLEDTVLEKPVGGIFFDAFSKLSPDLWTEAFLAKFLQSHCASTCVFATYASRKSLKTVLLSAGFKVQVRPGFAKKRECLLALRSSRVYNSY